MKKLLLAALVVLLLPFTAEAGFNFRQTGDGSACFVNDRDGREVFCLTIDNEIVKRSPTSGGGIEAYVDQWCGVTALTDLSTSSTAYIISPITGTLTHLWATPSAATSVATNTVTINAGGVSVGTVSVGTGTSAGVPTSFTPNLEMFQTQNIQVYTDGQANGLVRLDVTACIRP